MIFANSSSRNFFPERAAHWHRSALHSGTEKCGSIIIRHYFIRAFTHQAAGRRLVYLSDLHFRNNTGSRKILHDTLKAIRKNPAEVLLLGGDMMGDCSELELLPEVLEKIRETADCAGEETVAVLGNHERSKKWIGADFWHKIYREAGINLLEDAVFDSRHFHIYGQRDRAAHFYPVRPETSEKLENILLTHNPDSVIALDIEDALAGFSIALTGHTHGGQLRIPGIGALLTASRYGRYFDYGFFRRKGLDGGFIISSGLGSLTFPFRFNCPPEVLVLEFTSPSE